MILLWNGKCLVTAENLPITLGCQQIIINSMFKTKQSNSMFFVIYELQTICKNIAPTTIQPSCGTVALLVLYGPQISENWPRTIRATVHIYPQRSENWPRTIRVTVHIYPQISENWLRTKRATVPQLITRRVNILLVYYVMFFRGHILWKGIQISL